MLEGEDRKKGIGKAMFISEVVPSFYLAFSYKGVDEIMKLRGKKRIHVLSLIRIST